MVENTKKVIRIYFPQVDVEKISWQRLYPSSYNLYDYCQFKFFLKYHAKVVTPLPEIAKVGLKCHKMKDTFYKRVNFEKLISIARKYNLDRVKFANYIFKHFKNVNMQQLETTAMFGFSSFESNRIISIVEMFDNEIKILKFVTPIASEMEIKSKMIGGRIDTLFRDPINIGYLINDWKDGTSKPKEIPESYENQVHMNSMLFDDYVVFDEYEEIPERILPKYWTVTFPRYLITLSGNISNIKKRNLRTKIISSLDDINSHHFDMRCDGYHCKWNWNFQCEYFHPICKSIMENEFGMVFEVEETNKIQEEIWFDF